MMTGTVVGGVSCQGNVTKLKQFYWCVFNAPLADVIIHNIQTFNDNQKILWHKKLPKQSNHLQARVCWTFTGSPILFECLEFNYSFLMCSQLNCLETNFSLITSHRPGQEMARVNIFAGKSKKDFLSFDFFMCCFSWVCKGFRRY